MIFDLHKDIAKPFSQACVNNAPYICEYLKTILDDGVHVLEIGSGTGQHAVYFGQALPNVIWQASDVTANIPGITRWIVDAKLPNVLPPIELDVSQSASLNGKFDTVFMANTLHIMSWTVVKLCTDKIPLLLNREGLLVVYGPFNFSGAYTSDSNQRFDEWLKARSPEQGIRDFEAVNQLLCSNGFEHRENIEMPANNRLLIWRFKG